MPSSPGSTSFADPCERVLAELHRPQLAGSFGEAVPLLVHLCQSAELLLEESGDVQLAAAGLLHDLGWAHGATEASHAAVSAHLASELGCGPRVVRAIELHVMAKRYLVASDPDYARWLSPESRTTLVAQGGPMTVEECRAFHAERGAQDALMLRWADERAKDPSRPVMRLEDLLACVAPALGCEATGA